MAKKGPTPKRQWTPMERVDPIPSPPETIAKLEALAAERGHDDEFLDAVLVEETEMWANNLYIVDVSRDEEGVVRQLSIRRRDQRAARDWRDFMHIKNEIAGENAEAVELYPAMSRLMDTANQFWLWCLPPGQEFNVGFTQRAIFDEGEIPGRVQRPLDGFAEPGIGVEPPP